jgi:hypothetical protein
LSRPDGKNCQSINQPLLVLLFIAAMLSFFLGLLWFRREIYLATKSLRIGQRWIDEAPATGQADSITTGTCSFTENFLASTSDKPDDPTAA